MATGRGGRETGGGIFLITFHQTQGVERKQEVQ